jgi:hypothetical protein
MSENLMKRTLVIVVAALAAAALFAGLGYAVLVAAHLSAPNAITVYGLTLRRLWATMAALLALSGVVIGGQAFYRATRRICNYGPGRAIVALLAGLIGVINGGVNLAVANGGPGTGNGVVGGAAACLLGLSGMLLGGLALSRMRRTTGLAPGRTT